MTSSRWQNHIDKLHNTNDSNNDSLNNNNIDNDTDDVCWSTVRLIVDCNSHWPAMARLTISLEYRTLLLLYLSSFPTAALHFPSVWHVIVHVRGLSFIYTLCYCCILLLFYVGKEERK